MTRPSKKRSAEFIAYHDAKARCINPNRKSYKWYGARGIEFRFTSFEQFFAELGPRPSPLYSLDRVDNEGHYEPGNVRWSTRAIQRANSRPLPQRVQKGTVFEKCGKLYLRFYQNGRKTCEFLHVVDGDHYRAKTRKGFQLSPAVDALRAQRMVAVNAAIAPATETLIPDFWTNVYLKWAESEGLAQSTILGYQKIWATHLSEEFAGKTLAGYSTADGYAFLMRLRTEKNLGRHALAHVRNCASGIFTHAVTVGKLTVNPWHGVKQPRTPKPADTHAYSEGEAIAILNAIGRTDAKLLFALCAFMGLRPSEAAGLDWTQVGSEYLTVKSAVVSGVATGRLKNEGTQRDLLIIEPVKSLLAEWGAKCGNVTAGLLFTGRGGRPINSSSFAKHWIIPDVRAAGLEYFGLYSGRRGVATRINELVGINSAFATLGNSYQVTAAKYVKPQQAASDAGLRSVSTGGK